MCALDPAAAAATANTAMREMHREIETCDLFFPFQFEHIEHLLFDFHGFTFLVHFFGQHGCMHHSIKRMIWFYADMLFHHVVGGEVAGVLGHKRRSHFDGEWFVVAPGYRDWAGLKTVHLGAPG